MAQSMWVSANNPPCQDTRCLIVRERDNGTKYLQNSIGHYTTGLSEDVNKKAYVGFLPQGSSAVAWMPIPEPYTKDGRGWTLMRDKTPLKNDYFIVTILKKTYVWVNIALFNPDRDEFFGYGSGCPEVIAWRGIPKMTTTKK